MTRRKWAARIVRLAAGVVLALLLLTFLAVQIQQRTLSSRAERLLADMHQIRLYQSTWTDAQRLMHRWGAWGHYDGSCTATSCTYIIEMDSIGYYNRRVPRHAWLDWLLRHDRFNLYSWFGGRASAIKASFTVHDGTIWRESAAVGVSVPTRRMRTENDFGDLFLTLGAESRQRLHRTDKEWGFLADSEDELAQHPYYKVGRPGGCKINCEIGSVYYSTHTPPAEIERLSSYNFSCFTRFHPCAELEDLLPAAREWHLYKEDEFRQNSPPQKPCDVPAWALARDARYVLAVEALSTKIENLHESYGEYHHEVANVRIASSLKQSPPWPIGATVSADLFSWINDAPPANPDNHMIPGKRYIVFPVGDDRRDQRLTKDSPIRLERCGVQEDTPEIRQALDQGFAQNDSMNP